MEFIHLVQTIEAQNTTITNLEGQVAEQATTIANQAARIAFLEGQVVGQATTIANQAARIAFLEGQVVGQATTIANQAARITFLEGQVGEQAVNIPNQAARIVNLDNASKMMITIVFIFNENSFYEIEDERAATCYIARIPFKKTLADFFTVQYCEITVPDIFKFKYIGFSKDGVADIRMTNTSTKKIYRVKFSCTTETAKNEDFTHALVPFDASIQFTAGCALVSPPKNYSSEPQCFLFFTVNGRFIGNAIGLEKNIEELFPIFMLSEDNVQVTSKFGDNDFIYKIGKTFVEDWLKFK
uniref:Major sperm protein n=1 Tax=Meloidogyne incognita TaxID=6306 RepID=A0A914N5G2_MELIC